MDYNEKAALIAKLSESVGVSSQKMSEVLNRFDPGTGTLYCGDQRIYRKEAIAAAGEFCGEQKKKYEQIGKPGETMAETYRILEAIVGIYLDSLISGDKVVLK